MDLQLKRRFDAINQQRLFHSIVVFTLWQAFRDIGRGK
jgi:hypothetical protein